MIATYHLATFACFIKILPDAPQPEQNKDDLWVLHNIIAAVVWINLIDSYGFYTQNMAQAALRMSTVTSPIAILTVAFS